jgi:hypothetical protein
MLDYDQIRAERDLDFKIGGEEFRIHLLPMNMIGVWIDREQASEDGMLEFAEVCVLRIADAVEDGNGARERWTALCKSDRGPSYGELRELARKVWEAQSELPTMQPSDSAGGRGNTASTSEGA